MQSSGSEQHRYVVRWQRYAMLGIEQQGHSNTQIRPDRQRNGRGKHRIAMAKQRVVWRRSDQQRQSVDLSKIAKQRR
nr:MAG TPA: hypothetical protein [Caudoviricetes sp.]